IWRRVQPVADRRTISALSGLPTNGVSNSRMCNVRLRSSETPDPGLGSAGLRGGLSNGSPQATPLGNIRLHDGGLSDAGLRVRELHVSGPRASALATWRRPSGSAFGKIRLRNIRHDHGRLDDLRPRASGPACGELGDIGLRTSGPSGNMLVITGLRNSGPRGHPLIVA